MLGIDTELIVTNSYHLEFKTEKRIDLMKEEIRKAEEQMCELNARILELKAEIKAELESQISELNAEIESL